MSPIYPGPGRPLESAPKKIIICLDGTNDQIGAAEPTNVGKTFTMLSLLDPAVQIAYYDPGVGTLPSSTARGKLARRISQLGQAAFGFGIRANLTQAYTWLMQHYQFGDEIYVFGFSRGAYTARALVGMLNWPGLLRPGSENLVPYAVREYANNKKMTGRRRELAQQFADAFCWGTEKDKLSPHWIPDDPHSHANWHAVPIKYVGLWDTVEATGVLRWGHLDWPYTHELYNAERLRHAISIDEWRRPYREFPVTHPKTNWSEGDPDDADIQEAWFIGVHSDVGGTYPDARLARISLKWVVDGVVRDLFLREDNSYAQLCSMAGNEGVPIYEGELHKLPATWKLAFTRRRPIPDGAWLHRSVEQRQQTAAPPYRVKLPARYQYVAQQWDALVPSDDLAALDLGSHPSTPDDAAVGAAIGAAVGAVHGASDAAALTTKAPVTTKAAVTTKASVGQASGGT